MKISEFKSPENQLNEASPTLAAIKGMFTGQGTHQTLVQDIFLQDFYQDALTSLKNGVKGGLVDPEIKTAAAPEPESPPAAPGDDPTSTGSNPEPTPPGGSPAPTGNALAIVPPAAAPSALTPTPLRGPALTGPAPRKQLPPPGAAAKGKTSSWQPKPNKVYYSRGASQIPQTSKASNVTYTQSQPKPASQQTIQGTSKLVPIKPKTTEAKYTKLNSLFENIIAEISGTGKMSIADYMKKWFSMYMQGVNWSESQQVVNDLITKLQDEYPKNLKQNLNSLGKIALALSKVNAPAGAPAQYKQQQQQQQQEVSNMTPEKLAATFKAMRPRDKQKASQLIKKAGG